MGESQKSFTKWPVRYDIRVCVFALFNRCWLPGTVYCSNNKCNNIYVIMKLRSIGGNRWKTSEYTESMSVKKSAGRKNKGREQRVKKKIGLWSPKPLQEGYRVRKNKQTKNTAANTGYLSRKRKNNSKGGTKSSEGRAKNWRDSSLLSRSTESSTRELLSISQMNVRIAMDQWLLCTPNFFLNRDVYSSYLCLSHQWLCVCVWQGRGEDSLSLVHRS